MPILFANAVTSKKLYVLKKPTNHKYILLNICFSVMHSRPIRRFLPRIPMPSHGFGQTFFCFLFHFTGTKQATNFRSINSSFPFSIVVKLLFDTTKVAYLFPFIQIFRQLFFQIELYYTAEMVEFWLFAGNKLNQRWTWYAIDKISRIIVDLSHDQQLEKTKFRL